MSSYFLIELCSIDMLCICIHDNSSSLYLQYNIVELYSHWIVLYWHLTCYLLYTFIIPVQCIYNTPLFELYQLWFCSNALHIFLIIHSLRWLSERHIMFSYRVLNQIKYVKPNYSNSASNIEQSRQLSRFYCVLSQAVVNVGRKPACFPGVAFVVFRVLFLSLD